MPCKLSTTQNTRHKKAELADSHVFHRQQQKLHYLRLNINTWLYTTLLLPPVDTCLVTSYCMPSLRLTTMRTSLHHHFVRNNSMMTMGEQNRLRSSPLQPGIFACIHAARENLKHTVHHKFRVPLPPWGQAIMPSVYFCLNLGVTNGFGLRTCWTQDFYIYKQHNIYFRP